MGSIPTFGIMEWNKEDIAILERAVGERFSRFVAERRTDRKNLSELWNLHIKQVGITLFRHPKDKVLTTHDVIGLINFRNPEVCDSLCIKNPDRVGQYLLLSREIASKILMLGMP